VSRESEIRRIEALVAAVRGGQSRSLVVVGPPGIGKSWVCGEACRLADDFTVVGTRWVESEVHLGYSGLFDVLSPLLPGRVDRLLAPRSEALRGALKVAAAATVDPFAVAVATLDVLALTAEETPVLVVIDDAPWVDAASLGALRFAARRLEADRIGFLFAAREATAGSFAETGLDSLTVGGLSTAEAMALIEEFALPRVQKAVARALAEVGSADPLWLREAARELSPDERSGRAPLSERFRGPASVQQRFERLVHGLSPEARHALVALAADEQAPGHVMQQALTDLGIADGAMRAGIDCGLAHLEAGEPRFSHPLARTAALEIADPIQRRLAHAALARAWDADGEVERAAWHLAESGDGPDRRVCSALAGVARAARARGAPGAAAAAWQRAVETAPDADHTVPLRLERARDVAQAGRADEALGEVERILDLPCSAELRADTEILQGQLLMSQGRLDEAARRLQSGATRTRRDDPARRRSCCAAWRSSKRAGRRSRRR
jgi:hypothetical protein